MSYGCYFQMYSIMIRTKDYNNMPTVKYTILQQYSIFSNSGEKSLLITNEISENVYLKPLSIIPNFPYSNSVKY